MKFGPPITIRLSPAFPAGRRIPEIDRLKGFALLLVLAYHVGGVVGWSNGLHGETGVDIFLIASGFVLAINSGDLPAREFLKRRFLRIYPSYWAALFLFLFFNAKFFGDRRSFADIFLHVLGLHGFGRPQYFSAVNDSFWFISIIVLLYVSFFFLRRRLHDLSLIVGVAGVLTAGLCLYYQRTGNAGGLVHLAVRVPSAFLGMLLGQLASGRPLEIRPNGLLAIGLLVPVYLCLFQGIAIVYAIAALALAALYLAADRQLVRTHSGRAFLAALSFFGVYSYEIYLLHQPLMRDYDRLVLFRLWQIENPSPGQLWSAIAAAFAIVVAASIAIHKATDLLFRSLRRGPAEAGKIVAQRP